MPAIDPENPRIDPKVIATLTTKEISFALRVLNEQTMAKKKAQAAADKAANKLAAAARRTADQAAAAAKRAADQAAAADKRAAAKAAKSSAAAVSPVDPSPATGSLDLSPAPPRPLPLCHHVMPSGRRCRSPRCNHTRYCFFHFAHYHRIADHDRCISEKGYGYDPLENLPPIEDRASIQISISEVVRSLIYNRIDPRKAGLLLYAFSIAAANLRNDDTVMAADAVDLTFGATTDDPLTVVDAEEEEEYELQQAANQAEAARRKALGVPQLPSDIQISRRPALMTGPIPQPRKPA